MKSILIATAIATSLAGTAYSGALEFIPAVDAVMVSPITDWSGPYAGGMAATGNGTFTETYNFENFRSIALPTSALVAAPLAESKFRARDIEGSVFGAFAGFNIQRGSLVYGVEGAYSTGSIKYGTDYGSEFTSFIDLKARVGMAAGNALLYGFAGGTLSEYREFGEVNDTASPTGMNYGGGIDLLVTDRVFIGAEYIFRELSGDMDSSPFTIDATVQSVQARIGMNF